jgi:hypothetical protein
MKKNEPDSRVFETVLERRRKKRLRLIAASGVLLVGGGLGLFTLLRAPTEVPTRPLEKEVEEQPAPVLPPPPAFVAEIEEVIVVERAIPAPTPLAELDESDAGIRQVAQQLSPHEAWPFFLVGEGLIRRFVAIVDNIAQGSVPTQLAPTLRPEGPYRVTRDGKELRVDPKSWERYDGIGWVASGIDARAAAALFGIWQPRIRQAYRELGYPDTDFSRTLQTAFQELLSTPRVEGLPTLVPEGVGYAYADPELEHLSSAQKQLLRMGPRNMDPVQEKLREMAFYLGFPASQLPETPLYQSPPVD